jgi:hypothetical protein
VYDDVRAAVVEVKVDVLAGAQRGGRAHWRAFGVCGQQPAAGPEIVGGDESACVLGLAFGIGEAASRTLGEVVGIPSD